MAASQDAGDDLTPTKKAGSARRKKIFAGRYREKHRLKTVAEIAPLPAL
jgi:hypothetical protein